MLDLAQSRPLLAVTVLIDVYLDSPHGTDVQVLSWGGTQKLALPPSPWWDQANHPGLGTCRRCGESLWAGPEEPAALARPSVNTQMPPGVLAGFEVWSGAASLLLACPAPPLMTC